MPLRTRTRDDEDEDERDVPTASRYREEDEEETPRARRRAVSYDEDDDPPPPRRRREVADDDPPPRRRASRDEEEDEEEPPAPRRREVAVVGDEEEDTAPRRRRRPKDEDEEVDEPVPVPEAGFAGFRNARKASGIGDRFDAGEEPTLLKILDDEPVASWNVHWINKRPFSCVVEDCPLCDAGDVPRSTGLFNIVEITGKKPTVRPWEVGPGVIFELAKKGEARTGPLSKEYYAVSKYQQGKGPWKYVIDLVRSRDLEEEWGVPPLTNKQLDALEPQMKGKEYVRYLSRKELSAVVRGLDD